MTLIKTIAIAACHSQLQPIMYDLLELSLQLSCHHGMSVQSTQTFLIVRQLKCIVACVCLQQQPRGCALIYAMAMFDMTCPWTSSIKFIFLLLACYKAKV